MNVINKLKNVINPIDIKSQIVTIDGSNSNATKLIRKILDQNYKLELKLRKQTMSIIDREITELFINQVNKAIFNADIYNAIYKKLVKKRSFKININYKQGDFDLFRLDMHDKFDITLSLERNTQIYQIDRLWREIDEIYNQQVSMTNFLNYPPQFDQVAIFKLADVPEFLYVNFDVFNQYENRQIKKALLKYVKKNHLILKPIEKMMTYFNRYFKKESYKLHFDDLSIERLLDGFDLNYPVELLKTTITNFIENQPNISYKLSKWSTDNTLFVQYIE